MLYQSATIWGFNWKDMPCWEIEVRYGKFGSIEQAAKFGASVRRLHHLLGQSYLLLYDGIGEVHTINNQINITVRKQRQETFEKSIIDPLKDLTMVELGFAEIAELPESFHSLAYGVANENGQKLEVDGYLYFLSH